jgi:hypothetical protein
VESAATSTSEAEGFTSEVTGGYKHAPETSPKVVGTSLSDLFTGVEVREASAVAVIIGSRGRGPGVAFVATNTNAVGTIVMASMVAVNAGQETVEVRNVSAATRHIAGGVGLVRARDPHVHVLALGASHHAVEVYNAAAAGTVERAVGRGAFLVLEEELDVIESHPDVLVLKDT